jgi:hypothetical protein
MRIAVQDVRQIAPLALFRFKQEKGGSGAAGEGSLAPSRTGIRLSVRASVDSNVGAVREPPLQNTTVAF